MVKYNISIDELEIESNAVTLVKLDGHPSEEALEVWMDLFKQCRNNPDFCIITANNIKIEILPKNSAFVITGPNTAVVNAKEEQK